MDTSGWPGSNQAVKAPEVALFAIGAFGIILDPQDRVLLCHRRDIDAWNLPGGGVGSGELPTEAAIREVREETGLEVVLERLVGVYGKPEKDELVFVFGCHPIGGRLVATDEARESRYFSVDDMPANTCPKHVERIHDAVGRSAEPIIRRQTAPSTTEMLEQLKEKPSA